MTFVIRSATPEEIQQIHVSWAASEDWNPGLEDGEIFSAVDPEGFLVGVLDGVVITCIAAVQLNSSYGYIGYYICKPGYRGKGYGLQTFQAAQRRLSHLATVGLDGVLEEVENYRKSGFVPSFQMSRYGYHKATEIAPSAEAKLRLKELVVDDSKLVNAALDMMNAIYEVRLESVLQHLLEGTGVKGCVYYDETGERIEGWGAIRPVTEGFRVGPLYALNKDAATAILLELIAFVPVGSNVYVYVPHNNPLAMEITQQFNMTSGITCVRMYAGPPRVYQISQVFGLLTGDIGP